MTPTISVVPVDVMTQADWAWSTSAPSWRAHRYGANTTFDPFPAYRHDIDVARATADHIAEICPPRWNVVAYIPDREDVARSNGFSDMWGERDRDDERLKSLHGMIFMSGKRIPPHPAMTRYLIAHEYGHQMQWMLTDARGKGNPQDERILAEYAAMRGLPTEIHFGSGGRWHDSCAEVFACDFRIAVCEIETEFWPHGDIPRPGDKVASWWDQALADVSANPAKV